MDLYYVSFHSNIIGSEDATYVCAENEEEALEMAKPMINTQRLFPRFLNNYSRFYVTKVHKA